MKCSLNKSNYKIMIIIHWKKLSLIFYSLLLTEKLIELTDLKHALNDLEIETPLDEKAVLIGNIEEMSRTLDYITKK